MPNLDQWSLRSGGPYLNYDQDTRHFWLTCSILQRFKSEWNEHGWPLHLQINLKAKIWIRGLSNSKYHVQIIIKMSKSNPKPPASLEAKTKKSRKSSFFASWNFGEVDGQKSLTIVESWSYDKPQWSTSRILIDTTLAGLGFYLLMFFLTIWTRHHIRSSL